MAEKMHKYILVLPESTASLLGGHARERQVSITVLIRKYLKLGLLVEKTGRESEGQLIWRDPDGTERVVTID